MKRLSTALLVSVLSMTSLSVSAVDYKGQDRREKIEEYLQLTEEQAEQFHAVMKKQHDKKKQYRKSTREETLNQLSAILNEEQLEKMKDHMEKMKNRKKRKH